ncbi:MAG: MATE family efflux transporter [Eubacteriales bacterium]|nr:MATE family efflux transporter [Eubacteriales bacterium]
MFLRKYIGDKTFYKKMLVITLPILVQNVITNFVSLIDNIMVGQIGTEQMSGVAIVNQLMFVFNLCIFGGVSGAGIFTAQYHGKGDRKGVRDTFRAKLIIVAVISLVCILAFALFDSELISLFLHKGEDNLDLAATLGYGKSYLMIMLLQIPLFALSQAYSGTLRETGSTVLPMTAGVVAVFVNVSLNWVLIFGNLGAPKLGIEGAAVATVIARFTETFIVMFATHINTKKYLFAKGLYRSLRIPKVLIKDIVKKGFPLMLNEILWALGTTMLVQCYSLRGLEVISAQNISSTVSNLFFCSFFAFGSAISIIVGQLLGAGELERAKDEDRKIIFTTVVVCVVVGGVMAALSPLIPDIYNTTDTVKSIATSMLLISSAMIPVHGFVHTCYFTLRCGGKTMVTFLFDSVYVWTVCVPVAFILARFTVLPIIPLFAIVQSVDIIKCVVGYVLVKKGVWVNNLVENNE